MKAALKDPFTERFQLLCEYTIPVRSALFTHQQLLAQNMSRVGNPHQVRPCLANMASIQQDAWEGRLPLHLTGAQKS